MRAAGGGRRTADRGFEMSDGTHAENHIIGYGTFAAVWAVLLALTFMLVGANALLPPTAAVVATLIITPVKAGLVFYYFMHLKYESTTLKTMVFVALASLVVFIGMLFLDYPFRG